MADKDMIDASWRVYEIAHVSSEALCIVAVFLGAVFVFGAKKRSRFHRRGMVLLVGGLVGLVGVLLITEIYGFITWMVTGSTGSVGIEEAAIPPAVRGSEFATPGGDTAYPFIATITRMGAILGMAAVSMGVGMKSVAQPTSRRDIRSKKMIKQGVGLILVTLIGEVFGVISYLLAPAI